MRAFGLLLVSILLFASCSDDGDTGSEETFLNYDGENVTSPNLPPGNHEMAVRFPSFVTNEFDGRSLSGVLVYMYDVPEEITLNIYSAGSAAGPDFGSVTQFDLSGMQANNWNEIPFNEPVLLGGDLWIGFSWTQRSQGQTIGCDAGPANPNGDWIFLSTETRGWQTFRDLSGGESVNWNIRGIVGE